MVSIAVISTVSLSGIKQQRERPGLVLLVRCSKRLELSGGHVGKAPPLLHFRLTLRWRLIFPRLSTGEQLGTEEWVTAEVLNHPLKITMIKKNTEWKISQIYITQ